MKVSEAADLFRRAGAKVPPELDKPDFEKIAGTRRKQVDGINFRSTLEANAYQILKLWEQAGHISNLQLQPVYVLQPKMMRDRKTIRAITYQADFSFKRAGRQVVVDAKGYRMEVYRIKRKMFLAIYPDIIFEEWTRPMVDDLQYGVLPAHGTIISGTITMK